MSYKDKEKCKITRRKYYLKNKDKLDLYKIKWRKENRNRIKLKVREYHINNRERLYMVAKRKEERNLKSWEGYIPVITSCQVCAKEIYFNLKNNKSSIHFDHKTGAEAIKCNPTNWLRLHPKNKENEYIWESCDFGYLCLVCNTSLPTKNRIEWLEKALKYARK